MATLVRTKQRSRQKEVNGTKGLVYKSVGGLGCIIRKVELLEDVYGLSWYLCEIVSRRKLGKENISGPPVVGA